MNITDTQNCIIFDMGSGKTGVYFTELPEWAKEGQIIYIASLDNYFIIDAINYNSSKNAKVCEFLSSFTGVETTDSVTATYNRFDYEVWEVHINPYSFLNKNILLYINFQDDNFGEEDWISESIEITNDLDGYFNIKYKNTENNDIIWLDDEIETWFETNLYCDGFELEPDTENESNKTDTGITPISSNSYSKFKFTFPRLTTSIYDKVNRIFGCDTIMINNELYVIDSREKTQSSITANFYTMEITAFKIEDTISIKNEVQLLFPKKYVIENILSYGSGIVTDTLGNIIVV